ncbi:MAG TPA: hypothetical protein VFP84_16955 [Kofleriaceae bacterium]|nr:hypothetical protein [Kofleriaceae bacterium]
MSRALALGLACALAACTGDLDPAWQLDHTRIIAVRATPPGIAAGQTSTLDALLGTKGAPTRVAPPEQATVTSPASLADALVHDGDAWHVVAPSEDRLAAARTQMGLAADAPVPLEIGVAYAGQTLVATKVVFLGAAADNPVLPAVTINGQPAPAEGAEITIDKKADKNPVAVAADNRQFDVEWLTSCGTMHDFDLPNAYVKIEGDDPLTGEFGVVLRNTMGGVVWQLWPIQAQ